MLSPSRVQLISGLFLFAVLTASFCIAGTSAATAASAFTWLDGPSPPPSPSPSRPASSTTDSAFQSNVIALLDALPSAAAPTGFASLSRGDGADRAFVRGICRGDSAPDDCAAYLQSAVLHINGHCNKTSRRAAIWFDKCFLSYADTNASSAHEDAFQNELYNYRNVSKKGGASEKTFHTLMRNLSNRAVNGTPESQSPPAPSNNTGGRNGEILVLPIPLNARNFVYTLVLLLIDSCWSTPELRVFYFNFESQCC